MKKRAEIECGVNEMNMRTHPVRIEKKVQGRNEILHRDE
jgi:hypothetical protein